MGWDNYERAELIRNLNKCAKLHGLECVNQRAGRDKVKTMISRIRDVMPGGADKKEAGTVQAQPFRSVR